MRSAEFWRFSRRVLNLEGKKELDNGVEHVVLLQTLERTAADLRRHALGLAKAAGELEQDIKREIVHAEQR